MRLLAALGVAKIRCHALLVNQVPRSARCESCRCRQAEAQDVLAELVRRDCLPPVAFAPELSSPISVRKRDAEVDALRGILGQLVHTGTDRGAQVGADTVRPEAGASTG